MFVLKLRVFADIAAFKGHADACRVLLAADADTSAVNDKCGWTPLHYAAFGGSATVCEVLLAAGADKDAQDSLTGSTPLHITAENGRTEACEALLAAGADKHIKTSGGGGMPLHVAAWHGKAAVCDILLRQLGGADREAQDNKPGWTPLHYAAYKGRDDACRSLLAAGADKAATPTGSQSTPLHIAAENGHAGFCEVLLAAGADKQAEDSHGRTAEKCAVDYGREHLRELLHVPGPVVEEMEMELLGGRAAGASPRGTTTVNSEDRFRRGPGREIEFIEIHRPRGVTTAHQQVKSAVCAILSYPLYVRAGVPILYAPASFRAAFAHTA